MLRFPLTILIAIPLMLPTGFCACHLVDVVSVASGDGDDHDDADDPHDDPNCPCKMVDSGIRGFRSHESAEFTGAIALPTLADLPPVFQIERVSFANEVAPITSTVPRYLAFLMLLV